MNEDPGNSPASSIPPTDVDADPEQKIFQVLVANEQATLAIDERALIDVARQILADSPYESGSVSIAVVDDPTIHALNVQYLGHDYPTDVLSFVLESNDRRVEGELVVGADTAAREAPAVGWSPHNELLLYVIHGALHLVGYDDHETADQAAMYAAEVQYLRRQGVALPTDQSRWSIAMGEKLT